MGFIPFLKYLSESECNSTTGDRTCSLRGSTPARQSLPHEDISFKVLCPDAIAKMLDCELEVNDFEFQSRYHI